MKTIIVNIAEIKKSVIDVNVDIQSCFNKSQLEEKVCDDISSAIRVAIENFKGAMKVVKL